VSYNNPDPTLLRGPTGQESESKLASYVGYLIVDVC